MRVPRLLKGLWVCIYSRLCEVRRLDNTETGSIEMIIKNLFDEETTTIAGLWRRGKDKREKSASEMQNMEHRIHQMEEKMNETSELMKEL